MVQTDSLTKIIAIIGPTASGKTELSIALAKAMNAEIVSCDSMQIYQGFDIGTAKTKPDEMQGIKHHLIDVTIAEKQFSVSDYTLLASNAINNIHKSGKIAIIVGGTGLYLNCLIKKQSLANTSRDEKLRSELERKLSELGNEGLHALLASVDPVSARRLHQNDVKRVIRALEVYYSTGIPMSEQTDNIEYNYNCFAFANDYPREVLYTRINNRVDKMVSDGLIDEVRSLYSIYGKCQAMCGIGYKELADYIDGKATYDEAVDLIKTNSRNYAKRQLTWFRHQINTQFIDYSMSIDKKVELIMDKYNRG